MALTFDEKLDNFKSLLEYFVSHLEWEVNRDPTHVGYGFYIRPLLESNRYCSAGQGQHGDAIQQQIEPWAHILLMTQALSVSTSAPTNSLIAIASSTASRPGSTSRASGPLMPKPVLHILRPSLSLMLPASVPPLISR